MVRVWWVTMVWLYMVVTIKWQFRLQCDIFWQAWHGMPWCFMALHGLAWCWMLLHCMTWYGLAWRCMVWHDIIWYCMALNGTEFHWMTWRDTTALKGVVLFCKVMHSNEWRYMACCGIALHRMARYAIGWCCLAWWAWCCMVWHQIALHRLYGVALYVNTLSHTATVHFSWNYTAVNSNTLFCTCGSHLSLISVLSQFSVYRLNIKSDSKHTFYTFGNCIFS